VIEVLRASGRPLPALTEALMGFSRFLQTWWWAILAAVVSGVGLLRWTVRRPAGRRVWHRVRMRLPVLGALYRKSSVGRFAALLQTLLASGLRLPESLAVLEKTADNAVLEEEVAAIRQGLTEGSRLTELMGASRCFDAVAVRMLGIGEASGELEQLLADLSRSCERDVDQAAGRLLALLEPVLILVLAAVVAVILFAVLLPILEASNIRL
jgi:type II secretory pathway component PulF